MGPVNVTESRWSVGTESTNSRALRPTILMASATGVTRFSRPATSSIWQSSYNCWFFRLRSMVVAIFDHPLSLIFNFLSPQRDFWKQYNNLASKNLSALKILAGLDFFHFSPPLFAPPPGTGQKIFKLSPLYFPRFSCRVMNKEISGDETGLKSHPQPISLQRRLR